MISQHGNRPGSLTQPPLGSSMQSCNSLVSQWRVYSKKLCGGFLPSVLVCVKLEHRNLLLYSNLNLWISNYPDLSLRDFARKNLSLLQLCCTLMEENALKKVLFDIKMTCVHSAARSMQFEAYIYE